MQLQIRISEEMKEKINSVQGIDEYTYTRACILYCLENKIDIEKTKGTGKRTAPVLKENEIEDIKKECERLNIKISDYVRGSILKAKIKIEEIKNEQK